MTLAFAIIAACAYAAVAASVWRTTARRPAAWLVGGALVLHAGALLGEVIEGGHLTLGVTEALSVFAWQAAVLLWILCLVQPVQVLGLVIYPLAGVAALWATIWPSSVTAIPLGDWKTLLHVALSIFSFGFLTIAAVQAITLASQDRMLHRHEPNRLVLAMPALQTMEQLLFTLIALGFFVLSLSLLSGLLFVEDLPGQHLGHKTVISIAAWATFGALLWGRWRRGWRGRQAIRWTLSGYGVLILAYFGSKLVLEQILSRHWS